MKKFLIASIFLLFGSVSFADTIVGVGAQLFYERNSDGRTIETRSPFSLHGGYRFEEADLYFEYSMFRASESESFVAVTRDRHEFLFWARHLFKNRWQVAPYLGMGIGFHVERVETSFNRELKSEMGAPDSVIAFNGGLSLPISRHFEVLVETRLSAAARYAPNPTWGLGAAAGFRF